MSRDGTDGLDEEDIRLTAYFLWEQAGRPDMNPSDFWLRALELHRRAHANGLELEAGLESHRQKRAGNAPDCEN